MAFHSPLLLRPALVLLAIAALGPRSARGEDTDSDLAARQRAFAQTLRPVLEARCADCHGGGDELAGDVNLLEVERVEQLLAKPQLVRDLIEVLDSEQMPPEDQPPLANDTRRQMLGQLRELLHAAVAADERWARTSLRRMNRFQYNNAVRDLFDLRVAVFTLPERMLREHSGYFQPATGKLPDTVRVGSRPLGKSQMIEPRLAGVSPFPQDLRAEHGFDNRADHLTISPLLLEQLLRLGRSVVDSPDFNPRTCGIWEDFFAPPEGELEAAAIEQEVRARLRPLLTRAFRRPPSASLLDRYAAHATGRLQRGESFTAAMKAVAAAAIASPQFLYLYSPSTSEAASSSHAVTASAAVSSRPRLDDYALASRLSFFLWGSIPDLRLLELAEAGRLSDPAVLAAEADRMMNDSRLKRFCESFPTQWLQLQRIISSTPDSQRFPQFYFSKYRASMHMMLEPLLLFEAVLVENRPVLELIDSDFSYRSPLLESWYRDGTLGQPGPPTVLTFRRVALEDRRQGGVVTTAAVMTMTSGATRTQPITRGAWVAGAILNDPPEPPPADVPPLADEPPPEQRNLTLRERFAAHRTRSDCAACHQQIDPLGFALENYGPAGFWRDRYENGREVDASGTLRGREFADLVEFKDVLLADRDRFPRALSAHLLSYATGREVGVEDSLAIDTIVAAAAAHNFPFRDLIKQVVLSEPFRR